MSAKNKILKYAYKIKQSVEKKENGNLKDACKKNKFDFFKIAILLQCNENKRTILQKKEKKSNENILPLKEMSLELLE